MVHADDASGAGRGSAPSLDSIRFDTAGYELQGEPQPGRVRVWHSPDGDGVGLFFFPVPPDLPANAATVEELADFYRRSAREAGGRLVELGVADAGGGRAIRTILSVPQQPSGRTYIASLTVPYRDFSFVVKCQCGEHGPTGMKEAVLMDRHLAADDPGQPADAQVRRVNPDHPRHDAEFADHPVARARRVLRHVTRSLTRASELRRAPVFDLPRPRA